MTSVVHLRTILIHTPPRFNASVTYILKICLMISSTKNWFKTDFVGKHIHVGVLLITLQITFKISYHGIYLDEAMETEGFQCVSISLYTV